MADELVERLLRTHITRSTFGGVAAGCFHDALVNPDGAKAAARIQSDAAEIARLRAELATALGELRRVTGVKADHWRNVRRLAAITVSQEKQLATARQQAFEEVAEWLTSTGDGSPQLDSETAIAGRQFGLLMDCAQAIRDLARATSASE